MELSLGPWNQMFKALGYPRAATGEILKFNH